MNFWHLVQQGISFFILPFSIREYKCYFFATRGANIADPIEIEHVRNWMGDFSKITNVAKYGARLGQIFSRTVPTLVLELENIKRLTDILVTKGQYKYNFTDGCGEIAADLAEKVYRDYCTTKKIPITLDYPSVFQIRFGAFKGVLSVNPHINNRIRLRGSMEKYVTNMNEAQHRTIEVCKTSSTKVSKAAFLNRQFIMVLEDRGASADYFVKKQEYYLNKLATIMDSPENVSSVLCLLIVLMPW